MITYAILTPGDIMVGTLRSAEPPTLEAMADRLAILTGFEDRDALLNANPALVLGFAPVH
jgi:hypothetical protein